MEFDSYPSIEENLVAQSVYGGYSLSPDKALGSSGNSVVQPPSRRGTVPAHIVVTEKSTYTWRIYIHQAMSLNADVSYSCSGESGKGSIAVSMRAGSLKGMTIPTGKFVGEPNQDWQIKSFNAHRLGQLEFAEPGFYNITLQVNPGKGEELGFQWLWLGN
jgi:alpha-L-fucosidase